MKNLEKLILVFILSLSVFGENLFDLRSSKELIEESLKITDQLMFSELKLKNLDKFDRKKIRLGQYLILQTKCSEIDLKPEDIKIYLENTEPCLQNPYICLQKAFEENNDHFGSFYTWLKPSDIERIHDSLSQIQNPSFRRAKILNLIFNSLNLAIQEDKGPNQDSENYITQIFEGAGIYEPSKELPESRIDWAWCAAYITSIMHQAGSGFSFVSLNEQNNVCKEADKLKHCHPVQVEFILNWARRKANLEAMDDQALQKIKPGDILILLNPKNGRASHIGFYIAQTRENSESWIYSIEGNAGPFVNDKLEEKWEEVLEIVKNKNINSFDYERLIDRLTIVKRPLKSWDYIIKLG